MASVPAVPSPTGQAASAGMSRRRLLLLGAVIAIPVFSTAVYVVGKIIMKKTGTGRGGAGEREQRFNEK